MLYILENKFHKIIYFVFDREFKNRNFKTSEFA